MRVTKKQALSVRCPTCGAAPGEKCELSTGQPRTDPHRDRRLIAADISIDRRAVGSPAPDTGLYQHTACTKTETFRKGNILILCANRSCPNKGANWALQEKLTQACAQQSAA